MILPDKHIRLSESILGFGAFVLEHVSPSISISDLVNKVENTRETTALPAYHTWDSLVLTLDFLFTIGAITVNDDGVIERCG